jgi:rhodanese-related sulfurtransferase
MSAPRLRARAALTAAALIAVAALAIAGPWARGLRVEVAATAFAWLHDAPAVRPAAIADDPAAVRIDARDPAEMAVSTLPGALPLADVERDPAAFAGRRLVVFCTIGHRSGKAAASLRAQGLDAVNLRGGVLGWAWAGLPFVDAAGATTRRVHPWSPSWALLPAGYEAAFELAISAPPPAR